MTHPARATGEPEATISRGDGRSTSAGTTQSVAGTSAAGAGKDSR
jgi:hypothetical protein